jgi:hypothetical protein
MTQRMFRTCILLTLGFAASQTILPAQERNELEGIWSVSVNVTNCQTGAPIRTVVSLQQFRPDGSVLETANTASRGMSEGVWGSADEKNVAALYWFFRFNPDGTFASRASVKYFIGPGTFREARFTNGIPHSEINALQSHE